MAMSKAMISVFSLLCILSSTVSTLPQPNTMPCNETEKQALLTFKQALHDPGSRLSSWSAQQDCCRWNGVYCHNITGRVLRLDLQNPCSDPMPCKEYALGGKISSALLKLEFLSYLDLGRNDFGGAPIPSFLGSMRSLTYLNLKSALFGGLVPPQLGNLSNLQSLFLGVDYSYSEPPLLYVENLKWISHLSSLKYLIMDGVNLHRAVDWLESINMLSSLSKLELNDCELDSMGPSLESANFTSLTVLSLDLNPFNHEMPSWLFKLRHLNSLSLYSSELTGPISEDLGQLKHLESLFLHFNSLDGPVPKSIGNLSSLRSLYLHSNKLNGTLPISLGFLPNLEVLFIGSNSFVGTISEAHFNKLSKLRTFDMSHSPSLVFKVKSNWVPPFQLRNLWMGSCQMGPNFPMWLQTQTSLGLLDISNSGIVDSAPTWFWKWVSHLDSTVNISDNQISGNLSEVVLHNIVLDLSSNSFKGELPKLSPQVMQLRMANNLFSGSISRLFCEKLNEESWLIILDISTNNLSGELPDCWTNWPSLTRLNLGNNNLTGNIPDSMASLFKLRVLHLHNNSLSGAIPPSLRNCTSLGLLNLGGNKFSGHIPSWMGEITTLMVLSLRSNRLTGMIPQQICHLSSLIALDFSKNGLTGTIPKCFNNFSLMATIGTEDDAFLALQYDIPTLSFENLMLVSKGKERDYNSILKFVRTIDLSRNNLSGSIPDEISSLSTLQFLNLSFNHLMGSVTEKIGSMKSLESLDLSRNHFSGEIPQGMTNLTFLSYLDLSYNNFSGRIPSSTQLQSFDALSYVGNIGLCGEPLTKKCIEGVEPKDISTIEGSEGGSENPWFYIGMGSGFITGLWGVCGTLLLKKSWRDTYFKSLSNVVDVIYVAVAIRWKWLQNILRKRNDGSD